MLNRGRENWARRYFVVLHSLRTCQQKSLNCVSIRTIAGFRLLEPSLILRLIHSLNPSHRHSFVTIVVRMQPVLELICRNCGIDWYNENVLAFLSILVNDPFESLIVLIVERLSSNPRRDGDRAGKYGRSRSLDKYLWLLLSI